MSGLASNQGLKVVLSRLWAVVWTMEPEFVSKYVKSEGFYNVPSLILIGSARHFYQMVSYGFLIIPSNDPHVSLSPQVIAGLGESGVQLASLGFSWLCKAY